MATKEIERIYNDINAIKNRLENDPETILVLEERIRNGEGDSFEEVYNDLENCLYDVFKFLENKTKSTFNIFLVDEKEYYTECYEYAEYVGNIAINSLTNYEINAIYNNYKEEQKI